MIEAMRADGLDPDQEIIADGVFRRINDRAKPGKNELIRYVCFGSAGYYCHMSKLPEGRNWSSKSDVAFTPTIRKSTLNLTSSQGQLRSLIRQNRPSKQRIGNNLSYRQRALGNRATTGTFYIDVKSYHQDIKG